MTATKTKPPGTTITREREILPGVTVRVELVDEGSLDSIDLHPPASQLERHMLLMTWANLKGNVGSRASRLLAEALTAWSDDLRPTVKRRMGEEVTDAA